jgi:hypothetical protein
VTNPAKTSPDGSRGDFIHPITLSRAERGFLSKSTLTPRRVAKWGPVEEGNHGDAPEMIQPPAGVLPFTQRIA